VIKQNRLLSVGVFCGSSAGAQPEYAHAARSLGRALAEQDIALIYGGGHVGLMGVVADAVLEVGGRVVGVIPKMLYKKEVAHEGLTELRVVETLSERKALIGELSDAFIALPGGVGTLDELFEVWSWTQLGLQHKPVGLLNVEGYFDSLLQFFEHAVAQGFLRAPHRDVLHVGRDPGRLIAALEAPAA
jgi:uncharacterized protein (TIGR00730 family)